MKSKKRAFLIQGVSLILLLDFLGELGRRLKVKTDETKHRVLKHQVLLGLARLGSL
jgi:hypothetical protein